jgi:catechol 2,3-dioxygenase-like lactoylglutathione lyase family enzyme
VKDPSGDFAGYLLSRSLEQQADSGVNRAKSKMKLCRESAMAIHFNHTILSARDSKASADFLAEMLGLPAPRRWGPFHMVTTDNDANLDYMDTEGEIVRQHYAFLVGDAEFDAVFNRIREQNLLYWADPGQRKPRETNDHDGGRGLYFEDPNGHLIEIITRPYGSGGWNP